MFPLEPFNYQFFQLAMLAALLIMLSAGTMSPSVVARNQSFLTYGISQSMVLGIAAGAGTLLGGLFGAVAVALLAAALLTALERVAWLPKDAGIAGVSGVLFAVGVIILNSAARRDIQVSNILFGNLLGITRNEIAILSVMSIVLLMLTFVMNKKVNLLVQNEKVAQAAGVRVSSIGLVQTLTVAFMIAVAVPMMGALMVASALVMPGLIALSFSNRRNVIFWVSVGSAVLSSIVGLLASYYLNSPTGPTIVVCLGILWATLGLAGYIKRRSEIRASQPS